MKTKEELNDLRNEVEALNMKLAELTDEEMMQVTGGTIPSDSYQYLPDYPHLKNQQRLIPEEERLPQQ